MEFFAFAILVVLAMIYLALVHHNTQMKGIIDELKRGNATADERLDHTRFGNRS